MDVRLLLRKNLDAVEERIVAACRRVGRPRDDVTLVVVTKSVSAEIAGILPELGFMHLGENRPQELWKKAGLLPAEIRWHLIGHLQRNKIERTLPLVELIHSVDSLRLLEALETEAVKQSRTVSVLLEVNAGHDPNKQGFSLEEAATLPQNINQLTHIHVSGLMAMAPLSDDPEASRPTFAALRRLGDELRPALREPHAIRRLSMGMSGDYEVAVEEGATMVRVGSAIFQGLPTE